MLALAKRCERARGNNVGLFWEAHYATQPEKHELTVWKDEKRTDWTPEYRAYIEAGWLFDGFTEAGAFLDAAMSLVPEGWRWVMRQAHPSDKKKGYFARLETHDFKTVTWGKGECWITDHIAGQEALCWAATPALALCAAALRARAAVGDTPDVLGKMSGDKS